MSTIYITLPSDKDRGSALEDLIESLSTFYGDKVTVQDAIAITTDLPELLELFHSLGTPANRIGDAPGKPARRQKRKVTNPAPALPQPAPQAPAGDPPQHAIEKKCRPGRHLAAAQRQRDEFSVRCPAPPPAGAGRARLSPGPGHLRSDRETPGRSFPAQTLLIV